MTPLTKLVFLVSDEGFDAVEDFTQAQARLSMSEPSSQEASDAYAAYTMRKKELLDYIGELEKRCRIPRQSRVVSLFVNIEPRRNEQPSKYTPQADGT